MITSKDRRVTVKKRKAGVSQKVEQHGGGSEGGGMQAKGSIERETSETEGGKEDEDGEKKAERVRGGD